MKRIISNVMLVAAAATALFSCQKQEFETPEVSQEMTLTFASEKPAFDDETRTEWTGETIQWSKGDKISVAYTVNGTWQNASGDASGDAKLYKSEELAAASATALFNVSTYFKGTTEGAHVFYGVYPAPSETGFADAPVATLTVASSQNPKADSFDSNGDLMVGVSNEYSSRPDENETISLKWERLVAHAVISLKNINGLTAEEKIENITLTAQDNANLVGKQKVNLITKEVVKDNAAANVVKLGASNLTVNDGSLSFWACVLPETLTSLTVVVETDKATYTREITGISKTFKQNARNTLSIKMDNAVREEKVVASDEAVDVLNRALTGVTGTSYTSWSGKTSVSEAVYAGQSAGGNESIQLRSNNSNSGIVTTTSGGFAKKVVVTWNSNTTSGRTLNIYGSHTAYEDPIDLYATDGSEGTKLGTIVCGTSTELTIDGEYEYIGLRSNSGAMYIEEIKITWSTGALVPDTTPKLEVAETEIEISAEEAEGTVAVTCKNIEMVEARALVAEGSQEESDWLAAEWTEEGVYYIASANESEESRTAVIEIYALDAEGNELVEYIAVTQKGKVDSSVITEVTVEEFLAKSVDANVWYQLTGTIKEIKNTTYGNFYLEDETGYVYVYGLTKEKVASNDRSFSSLNLKVGDVVTLIGTRAQFANASVADQKEQVGGPAYYVSHVAACAAPVITCTDNTVTITAESGATIYYTKNGDVPTESSSKYTEAFPITENTTVKAIAVATGKAKSVVAEKACTYVDPNAGGDAEPVTIIIDGSTLTSTATTADSDHTFDGITFTMSKGAKYQTSSGSNKFTNKAILIGRSGAYIYNKTAIPGRITKFEIYANQGASAKVSVGVNFSSSTIKSYSASAANTYTGTLSTLDSVYDCSDKLPEDARYFWYQVTNSNNSQVQFRITYIPEN